MGSSSVSTGGQAQVFVVRPTEENPAEYLTRQQRAFDVMEQMGIEPLWLSIEKCMAVTARTKDIFVLPVFDGTVFDHLEQINCRVCGAKLIIECLSAGLVPLRPTSTVNQPITLQNLPKINHPVFSRALAEAVLCFVRRKIDPLRLERLKKMVRWMGGLVSADLTEGCTHLVASEVGAPSLRSPKYSAAVQRRLLIVQPEWVEEAWRRDADEALSMEASAELRVPSLSGLVISCTGMDARHRAAMPALVDAHGGRFTGDLKQNVNTHLVSVGTLSAKYRKALSWGITVVTKEWLDDSVAAGYCLDERDYSFRSAATASTPEPLATTAPPDPDFSLIPHAAETTAATVDETFQPSESRLLGASAYSSTPLARRPLKRAHPPPLVAAAAAASAATVYNWSSLDVSHAVADDLFDRCRVLLTGCEHGLAEKLKRMARAGSGEVVSSLADRPTHIVVGDRTPKRDIVRRLRSVDRPANVVVVSAEWLIKSYQSSKQLPVLEYVHEFPTDSPAVIAEAVESPIPSKRFREITLDDDTNVATATSGPECDVVNVDEPADCTDMLLLQAAEQAEVDYRTTVPVEQTPSNAPAEAAADDTSATAQYFGGVSFAFRGIAEPVIEECLLYIEQAGGHRVVDGADYLIFPDVDEGGIADAVLEESTCAQLASQCWLQMCLERSELLPTDYWALCRPVRAGCDAQAKPLAGVVLCFSGFEGAQRAVLASVAVYLGAVYVDGGVPTLVVWPFSEQGTMCRKTKRQSDGGELRATTHLVVASASGQKYETAVNKWRLPALVDMWLVDTIVKGERPADETRFDAANAAPVVRADALWLRAAVERTPRQPAVVNRRILVPAREHVRLTVRAVVLQDLRSAESSRRGSAGQSERSGFASTDSPGQFLDANVSFRPRFDLRDAQELVGAAVDSPAPTRTSLGASFIARQLAIAVDKTGSGTVAVDSPATTFNRRALSEEVDDVNGTRNNLTSRLRDVLEKAPSTSPLIPSSTEEPRQRPARSSAPLVAATAMDSPQMNATTKSGSPKSPQRAQEKIGWVDPLQEADRQRLVCLQRAADDQSQSPTEEYAPTLAAAAPIVPAAPPPKRVFAFSSIDAETKAQCVAAAKQLGGEPIDAQKFERRCTHLVVGALARNEKFLCALAAGKWIVHPDYLLESAKVGRFLPETTYEWGGEGVACADNVKLLAAACQRWRERSGSTVQSIVQMGSSRPFAGWNAVLYTDKGETFSRIVECGGGAAHARSDVASLRSVTHALVEQKFAGWSSAELDSLLAANVKCFGLTYISAVLFEKNLDETAHLLPDCRARLRL